MLKKTLGGTLVLGFAAAALLGTDVLSYARTMCGNVREAVKSEISPEFELDRIRHEVDNLMPEVREHKKIVAQQVVEVRDLEARIREKSSELVTQKAAILTLRTDLESGRDEYRYHQVSYTRNEVESDLADRFEAFRRLEDSLERDHSILAARKKTLRANQQKLESMIGRKQNLAVQVSELEARLNVIQATETVQAIEMDDTRLGRVEKLISQLNHDLDVREAMLESEGSVAGRIPVDEPVDKSDDVLAKIDRHFGNVESASVAEVVADQE